MIDMSATTVEGAEKLICERGRQNLTSLMPESRKVMADFAFATKVNAALVEKGYYVEVYSDDGNIIILATQLAAEKRLRRGRIKKLVERVPGVTSCEIFPEDEPSVSKKPSGILLVDDEVEFVQTLSERLQMRDFNTAVAYDGREALTHIQSSEPAVMILDLRMPRIDGVDVLRKVKKDNPNLEVIILTGHGTEEDRELTLKLGAFAFLEKPVEAEILVKTVREAYEKIARERAERSLTND
jgi:CheY-like chemotaxis protein